MIFWNLDSLFKVGDLPPGKIGDMVLLFAFAAIITIHWIRTIL